MGALTDPDRGSSPFRGTEVTDYRIARGIASPMTGLNPRESTDIEMQGCKRNPISAPLNSSNTCHLFVSNPNPRLEFSIPF
jgi:hypothetical protein